MSRILPILLLLILQACQVKEEVASAKQIPQHVSNPQFTVVVSNDGWKKLNDSIQVSLQFPFNVNVSGAPYINVTIGSYIKRFYYFSGTGTKFLVFKYNVTSLDKDTDGIEFASSIELNGGSLTYLDSQSAAYATTNTINVPESEIKVDGIVPTISPQVQYAINRFINYYVGWKNPGDSIDIKMNYPYAVLVSGGTPYINVIVGSISRKFSYYSGTGTGAITYRYTLTSADVNVDKIAISNEISLNAATLSYLDVYGVYKSAATSLNYTGLQVQIDGVVPAPFSITPPVNGIYATNQDLKYIVDFSEKVYVTGVPGFSLAFDAGGGLATYASGSGTTSLNFKRNILVGDNDINGFSTGGVLNLNSFTGIEIKDEAGNSISAAFPIISSNIMINVTGPTILSVSPPTNGDYALSQHLSFTVVMSEAVTVTGVPNIPITLTTGNVAATFYDQPAPDTLVFRYTVVPNQQDLNGITLTSPIALSGGTIKNLTGTKPALLTYAAPVTSAITVNSVTGPYILTATAPASGTYIEGQNLDYSLRFNVPVSVNIGSGTPKIGINLGSGIVYANYQPALSSSTQLVFRYTATIGDNDLDGLSVASPLILNGGIIQDATSLNANLAFSPPDSSGVKVDAVKPTIASVAAPLTGNYRYGQSMYLSVTMSEAVTVTGTPLISMDIGGTTVNASYLSGSGSALLTFKYDVQLNRFDTNGIDLLSPVNLNGGTIVDAKGHALTVLTYTIPVSTGVLVDALAPSIISVTPPAAGTYAVGDALDFIVNWSEDVSLSGTPHIVLDVGGTAVLAKYVPTSSSSASTFRYTVGNGQSDLDDISIPSLTIVLNSGTIKDLSANDASLGFALPILAGVLVNGSAPSILSVTTPTPVTHKIGSVINFTVTWSEPVTMAGVGVPKLKITIGSSDVLADYTAGSGTAITTFSYTVLPSQNDTDGIALNTTVHLGTATIKDLQNNVASLLFDAPSLSLVNVDGIAPAITLMQPPANENYQNTQSLDFKVTWDEKVTVTGSPRIALNVNCVVGPCLTKYADYVALGSTNTMKIFRFTVGPNDVDTNGIEILPAFPLVPTIDLNGGTIEDVATNPAAVTFARPVLTNVLVDGATPYIVSITPPANGLYGSGMNLNVTIKWSEIVNVTTNAGLNRPYVFIKVGGANRQAFYSSGTGTTDIVFTYTLIAGENDTNGIDVLTNVELNTFGTIQDGAGNNVYRSFLNTNYPLVKVDAVLPYVLTANSTNITGGASKNNYFSPSHTIQYNVTFSEPVTWTVSPTIVVDIGGNFRVATYFGGTGTSTLTFRIILDAGDVLLDLNGISVAATIGGTIRDVALNTFAGSLPFSEKDYVYYANMIARYHVADYLVDYTTSACFPFTCIATVKDITGNGHNIAPTGTAPIVASNFGTQLTKAMDFSNMSTMRLPATMSIKYAIFAMKNVSNASTSATTSTHTLLNSWNPTGTATHFTFGSGPHTHGDDPQVYFGGSHSYLTFGYTPLIQYTSNASSKTINMSPTQKLKIDGGAFPGAYVSSETGPALWTANDTTIYIHEFSAPENTFQGTLLGGGNFTGQVAEAIFFTSTANITEAKLEEIRDQLNAIHGAY